MENTPNQKVLRIACVGEVMLEVSKQAGAPEALLGFAGDTFNTAVYLRRLLPATNYSIAYVSVIGRDAMSDELLEAIAGEGIDCDAISRHPTAQIGAYASITNTSGERSFVYWRSQSAARTLFQTDNGLDFSSLLSSDIIVLSAITLAILPEGVREGLFDWLEGFRQRGGRVVFDSNYRPTLWPDREQAMQAIERAWQLTDIALPSVDDEMAVFSDPDIDACVARLSSYGFTHGALKQGALGPRDISSTPEAGGCFPMVTEVVDTTAAGDSFNAAYLAALLSGEDAPKSLAAGHALASQVVTYRGAIIPRAAMGL